MTREEFVAQLERGAAQAAALPVTSAVLRWTAEQLKRGEPPWWKSIAKAWSKRAFVAWDEAWSLYMTALHFEALSDAECPLVPYFPSCGGTAEAEPAPGIARFLLNAPPSFFENLRVRHRRTYLAYRSKLWIHPAALYFDKRGLPYYLVEVNAGAGLNLAADLVIPHREFDSGLIAARIGLDPDPLDLADLTHRRWLTAGSWPELGEAIVDLDRAIDVVQSRQKREANFIQLAPCEPEKAPAFFAKNIPADDPDVGLLVFNMGTTVRMTDADYAAYSAAMVAMLKPWGNRGLWVEAELVRAETYSNTMQLRAHRADSGQLRSLTISNVDFGAAKQDYNKETPAFLAVP
jgi:hypothetical protein